MPQHVHILQFDVVTHRLRGGTKWRSPVDGWIMYDFSKSHVRPKKNKNKNIEKCVYMV